MRVSFTKSRAPRSFSDLTRSFMKSTIAKIVKYHSDVH